MPSSEKPTNTLPGKASGGAKPKPKTTQRQTAKTDAQAEKETDEVEVTNPRERKTSSKLAATKESKVAPAAPRAEARVRKLTPQQQIHLARARRRKLNERLGLGVIAVVVIVAIVVIARQVITKSQEDARLATAHQVATSTAVARATATQTALDALSPDSPPTVTGTTVTTKDGLQYIDIKVGTGDRAVKENDTISVHYVGWLQPPNCQEIAGIQKCRFDSSYIDNKGTKPTQFTLASGSIIKGWIEGITGMKPGGTRRLIIPGDLAYGKDGQPNATPPIPANATLIFDVELVTIDAP